MNKKAEAIRWYEQGQTAKALAILRDFKYDFNKAEQRVLQIACDCLEGHGSFYKQIGLEPAMFVESAISLVESRYGIHQQEKTE